MKQISIVILSILLVACAGSTGWQTKVTSSSDTLQHKVTCSTPSNPLITGLLAPGLDHNIGEECVKKKAWNVCDYNEIDISRRSNLIETITTMVFDCKSEELDPFDDDV